MFMETSHMQRIHHDRRMTFAAVAAATLLSALTPIASVAQANWPTKPIKLIVPFPAGGGTDIIARELRNKMTSTGWNIVVDNKPGSGGNIGVDAAAKSAPDGYTLVLGQTSNLAINPTLYSKLPYDPRKDLTAISTVAISPLALVVAADSPYKTLADVIAAAKAKPDSLNYATSGNGTVAHLAMELFQKEAGVKMTHIPYKGAAQGANDLIGGLVQLYTSSVPTLISHIRNGRMRALAVTSATRADDLPDVPTVAESGYKDFEAATWFGVLGPAGMPKDVVARLNAEINKALELPDFRKRLGEQGAEVLGGSPEKFTALVDQELDRWGKVVKESGAKAE
jgi:tripartite-type tricarboxylate transporter receptor subunit TctC